jgi:hypothetical protein
VADEITQMFDFAINKELASVSLQNVYIEEDAGK